MVVQYSILDIRCFFGQEPELHSSQKKSLISQLQPEILYF